MKRLFSLFLIIFLSNCSFNDNSNFWTSDVIKKKSFKEKLEKIIYKSNDIMSLTFDEYKTYIIEKNKNKGYPDLND